MSPHDFRNEDSQNRVRKPSRSPSRVRPAPGTRLWRQLGSTNENLPVRPSPVHEPIEHAAKQMRDSRPLPPRLAPCRTTAILRKTALKERGRRAGVVAGKDRTAPQQSQIPSGLVRCERSEEHTSELQSQSNLVCRLLLEKKKNNTLDKYIQDKKNHVMPPLMSNNILSYLIALFYPIIFIVNTMNALQDVAAHYTHTTRCH